MIIIAIPICILGLVGNVLVFYFLSFKVKRTRFTLYILNITIGDTIVLVYQYIYFMLFLQPIQLTGPISHFIEIMYILGENSGFYVLTAVCLERCFSVFPPILCQFHRPKHLAIYICFALWTFSGLVSIIEYYACRPRFYAYLDEDSHHCYIQTIFKIVTGYFILIPLMVFSTLAIFIRMLQKRNERTPAVFDFTIIGVVIFFLIFQASIRLLFTLEYWYDSIGLPLFSLSVLFDTISSSINPFLYFFMGYFTYRKRYPLEVFLQAAMRDESSTLISTENNRVNNTVDSTVNNMVVNTVDSTVNNMVVNTVDSTVNNRVDNMVDSSVNNMVISTENNTVFSTENNMVISTENNTVFSTENNMVISTENNMVFSTENNTVIST
nr:proto-oncogene Mas-like [Anolis sagrei ordinatus]